MMFKDPFTPRTVMFFVMLLPAMIIFFPQAVW